MNNGVKFAHLLTEGIKRIHICEGKNIQIIQDELGYALGKKGGASIENWRKGKTPAKAADVEILARKIVERTSLGCRWLEEFLQSANYPRRQALLAEMFPPSPTSLQSWEIPGAAPLTSPFSAGFPITQPRRFFGRTREIQFLFSLWKNLPLQNAAVIGPRRSGKTSLLHYLSQITTTPAGGLAAAAGAVSLGLCRFSGPALALPGAFTDLSAGPAGSARARAVPAGTLCRSCERSSPHPNDHSFGRGRCGFAPLP